MRVNISALFFSSNEKYRPDFDYRSWVVLPPQNHLQWKKTLLTISSCFSQSREDVLVIVCCVEAARAAARSCLSTHSVRTLGLQDEET